MNESADSRETTEICDQIQSVAISAAPESTGVTTFVQEACTAISAIDSKYCTTPYAVQTDLQDVREYFRRPVCIRSAGVPANRARYWSNNGTFSSYLSVWTNGLDRLRGAFGIRAKIVFTLQVAATPFHQGILCLSAQYGFQNGFASVYDRATDSCTATNLPSVMLDLSVDTSVQLHLPYLSPSEYSDVRGTVAEPFYLQVSLNNLNQIPSVAGMGAPTYQVYIHLEDIELFGATPQAVGTVVLTAGRKLSPVTEEFEKDSHPFSSALYASSRAVSFVAKGVPSISSIGGPVSWALGKAAGIVRYFGYGKPAVTDPVMRVLRMDNVGEFNTDVATGTMVLAATAANTTSINTQVGYSDVDEMSLSYVTSRWSQINVFDYTTSSAAATLLYATPICPLAFWFRAKAGLPASNIIVPSTSTATSNSVQPSHVMFAASSFKQWRGGLKFRFTFVKTKMHAGRVLVNFNPYQTTVNNNVALTSSTSVSVANYGVSGPDPFGYSAVFDLKDGNVFEFKVPYVCSTPYVNLASTTGALSMYVVNPLIASSVVASNISVIVEVAGDVDFELANPTGVMFSVHNGGTIRLNAGRILSEAPEVINQLTMGEAITSVKQLISIPHTSYAGAPGATPFNNVIAPWYFQPTPSTLVPVTVNIPPQLSFSYGGNWASCYGFLKGGTDLHVYDYSATCSLFLSQISSAGGFTPANVTPANRSISNAPTIISMVNGLHARLPAFFPTARVFSFIANALVGPGSNWASGGFFVSGTNVSLFSAIQSFYQLYIQPNSLGDGSGEGIAVNRHASDDAQLTMYIGPPPIFLPAANPVGAYDANSYISLP